MRFARALGCGFLLLFGVGCQSDEARLRVEAQRFIALYQQVDYDASPEARGVKLTELEKAVFVAPEVVLARGLCLSGHRQLIDAQRVQDETAAEIDKALAGTKDAQPLPLADIARMQEKVQASQATLGQARRQLEACEAQTRALDLRFGKR